ncbi:MAG: hypothetical protein ACE5KQ_07050 [Thermoplasmata archaeon]
MLERLEILERQNRWLKRVGVVVMVLAGALLLIGQAQPKWKIEAERFVVKDANGKVRAELGMAGYGPALVLYDGDGTRRAALGIAQKGPALFIFDTAEKRRAAFGVGEKGPALALYDGNGKTLFFKP